MYIFLFSENIFQKLSVFLKYRYFYILSN